jgi:hypothetical protein
MRRGKMLGEIALGLAIALTTWWLVDHLANEVHMRRIMEGLEADRSIFLFWAAMTLTGCVATLAMIPWPRALGTAVATYVTLMVLSGAGLRQPLVTLPRDLHFSLVRGSLQSAVWVTLGVWVAILVNQLWRRSRDRTRPGSSGGRSDLAADV